jgi:hypothetical protein
MTSNTEKYEIKFSRSSYEFVMKMAVADDSRFTYRQK